MPRRRALAAVATQNSPAQPRSHTARPTPRSVAGEGVRGRRLDARRAPRARARRRRGAPRTPPRPPPSPRRAAPRARPRRAPCARAPPPRRRRGRRSAPRSSSPAAPARRRGSSTPRRGRPARARERRGARRSPRRAPGRRRSPPTGSAEFERRRVSDGVWRSSQPSTRSVSAAGHPRAASSSTSTIAPRGASPSPRRAS